MLLGVIALQTGCGVLGCFCWGRLQMRVAGSGWPLDALAAGLIIALLGVCGCLLGSTMIPVHTVVGESSHDAGTPIEAISPDALANVAHELRTPLQAIIGYSTMLVDGSAGALTREQRDIGDLLVAHANRLTGLINNVLDMSRIEAGVLDMTMLPVSLLDCVYSAYETVRPAVEKRGLEFVADMPDHPLGVLGSKERLCQVFINLFHNAVKFTEKGKIGVRGRVQDGCAIIETWDSGIGIPPEALPHIFDKYRQADASIRRRFGGSGLGLALSRSIVELHQGKIEARSEPGQGSTFIVTLPLACSPTSSP